MRFTLSLSVSRKFKSIVGVRDDWLRRDQQPTTKPNFELHHDDIHRKGSRPAITEPVKTSVGLRRIFAASSPASTSIEPSMYRGYPGRRFAAHLIPGTRVGYLLGTSLVLVSWALEVLESRKGNWYLTRPHICS